ncbi:SRPBCC domain-containing protein [Amycolatopsis acidiphila]|uniref:SRPBCC domain-containing protein n=1 Tax=Amycolatopsis acidiphila TaxID=715473 RepID=A0A558AM13_9PSEU|nr:SRPBCC domain-containing protein [Amycolatopsis acidiphila]TVT25280.1 SRPBCC domain-containing protein [Amycolatopsis acidiphila]UIJ62402.1 SRPBCC domain-containing protein [Amycolatopsis acidiphila]GHG83494.1 hypothetical protein GCM10017788_54640 [Amycolatopsis acidiphila]
MTEHSFSTTILVDRTTREAFDAIGKVRAWWSECIDGPTAEPGDEFVYDFAGKHRCTIRVTEAVPGRKVAWLVLDNEFDFTRDETEWVGNTMIFDIGGRDGRTEVRFTQQGLVPAYECFDVCATAWSFFVGTSLKNLITTGQGLPSGRDIARVPAEEHALAQRS